MIRFLVTRQAEPRTLRIIDRALVRTSGKSSPAALKEGSAPEDEEWVAVASPDRKKDRAQWDWEQDHLPDDPRYGVLSLHRCQDLVIDRQASCPTVGECWPAVAGIQKPGTHTSAL
jgi:hypothetical protein